MKILLITPVFYGYEIEIKAELERQGHSVHWIENKEPILDFHGTRARFKLVRRLYFLLFSPQEKYLKAKFKKVGKPEYDLLFSINCHIICRYLFRFLKKQNPQLKAILFLWDSFEKYNWKKEISYFDKVYTFDKRDSEIYGLGYRPNFYMLPDHSIPGDVTFDLYFAGKFNASRLKRIEDIMKVARLSDVTFYFRLWPGFRFTLHNKLIYRILKRTNSRSILIKDFILNYEAFEGILKHDLILNDRISFREIQIIMLRSNVVLDLPFELQTGYSHRLIEALGNGKKILTTNRNIIHEKFYNENQVHILGRLFNDNDIAWVKQKESFPVKEEISDLQISNWLKSIIDADAA